MGARRATGAMLARVSAIAPLHTGACYADITQKCHVLLRESYTRLTSLRTAIPASHMAVMLPPPSHATPLLCDGRCDRKSDIFQAAPRHARDDREMIHSPRILRRCAAPTAQKGATPPWTLPIIRHAFDTRVEALSPTAANFARRGIEYRAAYKYAQSYFADAWQYDAMPAPAPCRLDEEALAGIVKSVSI